MVKDLAVNVKFYCAFLFVGRVCLGRYGEIKSNFIRNLIKGRSACHQRKEVSGLWRMMDHGKL